MVNLQFSITAAGSPAKAPCTGVDNTREFPPSRVASDTEADPKVTRCWPIRTRGRPGTGPPVTRNWPKTGPELARN